VGFHQPDSLSVEGDKGVPTKPPPFIGDDAVGKVAARIEQRKPGFSRRSIHDDVRAVQQASYRSSNIDCSNLVALRQHPDQLAKRRDQDRYNFRFLQCGLRGFALWDMILG